MRLKQRLDGERPLNAAYRQRCEEGNRDRHDREVLQYGDRVEGVDAGQVINDGERREGRERRARDRDRHKFPALGTSGLPKPDRDQRHEQHEQQPLDAIAGVVEPVPQVFAAHQGRPPRACRESGPARIPRDAPCDGGQRDEDEGGLQRTDLRPGLQPLTRPAHKQPAEQDHRQRRQHRADEGPRPPGDVLQ